MKRLFISLIVLTSLFSCLGKKQYYMSKQEKSNQKGFNANQANKIVNENQKNKAANQKSSEKNRQQINKAAEEKSKNSKNSKKPSGEFKFYFH